MIKLDIHIEKYDWKVTILFGADIGCIIRYLRSLYCDSNYINGAIKNIAKCKNDYGFTVSNLNLQKSVININKFSDEFELLNTIVHECRHVQSHVADRFNLNEKGENVAYMIGEMVMNIVKAMSELHSSTGGL